MGLTKSQIDNAEYDPDGGSWQFLSDIEDGKPENGGSARVTPIEGFGVRLYESGRKAFVLRYKYRGRDRYMTLGKFGALTVEQARNEARGKLAEVRDGKDPAKDDADEPPTLREFAEKYLKKYAKPRKKSWKDDKYRIDGRLVPAIGGYRLDELDTPMLTELHRKIGGESRYQANRTLQLLRNMLNRARKWGDLPASHPNPAAEIEWFNEKSRDRWLRPEEIERLLTEIDKEEDPYVAPAVRLYLLTGLRRTELLAARWEHVDLDRGEIRLPDTKSGEPQTRKLSSAAVEILKGLPREKGSDYVFPSPRKPDDHRKDFRNEWEDARERAGLEDVTLHDLRRTAGSWMAQNGVPLQVIQEVLGHSHPSVTKLYARLSSEQEAEAVEALGDALASVPGVVKGDATNSEEDGTEPEPDGERADTLRALLENGADPDTLRALADLLEGAS